MRLSIESYLTSGVHLVWLGPPQSSAERIGRQYKDERSGRGVHATIEAPLLLSTRSADKVDSKWY